MAPVLRLVGVIAYFWMAHRAIATESELFSGIALSLLVFIVYVGRLLRAELRAVIVSVVLLAGIAVLVRVHAGLTGLLLVPTVFLMMAAGVFARTLIKGRIPLLVAAASLIENVTPAKMDASVRQYTTRQTLAWAVLLYALAFVNLVLALWAVPDGVLSRLGFVVPGLIRSEAVARFMPWLIYGSVGGLLVGEFLYRQRKFPGRYKSALDYVRKLAKVPLADWQTAFAQS